MNEQSRQIVKSLAEMAWADGQVSPEERSLLIKVLAEAGASPQDIEDFDSLLSRPGGIGSEEQPSNLQDVIVDDEGHANVMRALLIMSFMDGVLSFAEFAHIEKVAKQLDIGEEQMELLRAEANAAAKSIHSEG